MGEHDPSHSPLPKRFWTSFHLVWLDPYHHVIDRFNSSFGVSLGLFTDADVCIDDLSEEIHERVFLIVDGAVREHFISSIHDIPQLYSSVLKLW